MVLRPRRFRSGGVSPPHGRRNFPGLWLRETRTLRQFEIETEVR